MYRAGRLNVQAADADAGTINLLGSMPGEQTLSVVVVTYNCREAVGRSLPPLVEQLREDDELVVVDNASTDGTPEAVRELAPGAALIEPGANLGFAAGCNAGAARASGELLLFLNPDAAVSQGFAPRSPARSTTTAGGPPGWAS